MAVSSETEQERTEREERERRDRERRQYQNEKSSKDQQKQAAEAEKAAIEKKIERLKVAYSKVHAAKENIGVLNSDVKKKGDKIDEWIGQNFDEYGSFVDGEFKSDYSIYNNELDEIQDEINREISRLQNQAAEYGTLIDQLWARICQLGRWIQDLFN